MKRKAEKQQSAAPVSAMSAVAARKARQQQAQAAKTEVTVEITNEPPTKRPRRSLEGQQVTPNGEESKGPRTRSSTKQEAPSPAVTRAARQKKSSKSEQLEPQSNRVVEENGDSEQEEIEQDQTEVEEEMAEDEVASVIGDADGYESPAETPAELQNFPLSKARLNKSNILYADDDAMCVRIKEKTNLALLGQYDIWVKRGVVSLMGAKLHPSARAYRVYAPSTHSLPVIKCVSGVEGEAEVEIKSCKSGIARLRDISPIYQKIWNGQNTAADKFTLKGALKDSRRTFSVLYTSADDPLKRHLRPLHLDKKWSASMKALSQRHGRLRVLVCGPKASGKSTFSRYLLNHVLSPAPETENGYINTDGCAFLDLDPGQPEFAPMGQVYLAHLRAPFFGPPFTHPSLDDSRDGQILRAHHIGATSPKEDPDHYALATMDLMEQYRSLLTRYPQCPLIINYPGWIFGQGLEVATWLIKTLGLSDVVYMSEKGPSEVVEPLSMAANEARVQMTVLPSQPTDFVSRSSAQLRLMQIQSYFHMSHPSGLNNPLWSDAPLSRTRPITVDYAGDKQGILGIMVLGSHINPAMLREVLEGAIVGVVAVESPSAIMGTATHSSTTKPADDDNEDDIDADEDIEMNSGEEQAENAASESMADSVSRTPEEDLPYLCVGTGTSVPLNPSASNCLGLALIRSVDVASRRLELSTPIPSSRLSDAIEQGHELVLVRGQVDNPNWAISEEYYAARAAERRYQKSIARGKKANDPAAGKEDESKTLAVLRERIRRASNVPWMTVVEDNSRRHREAAAQREKSLWKLRKKAYPGSESETDW
ncbi:Polynucleotide 5'-hydroxyl-kinase grc3 [Penicillium cataractarum]|uniref:Polynucleotide 5'-hydroxyl-kinase GRC3 n=1 Tax=Penicillium cataractarum TaxID=2100454 RepID=A0A9W9VWN6_9EURO|nr:Polynucleotide 5'-hydroxyl-kinase grc3 [Penicillium cataractarum]KAJ5390534.1 Polynucleotide 5'-hydroxyl-kinase grc3 [Penicillium cataractarum]